ncbi:lipoma hmgic fusion partner-like protein [Holotrichia oblita]|uniref:Lipoma hmgic fusion partner-like protein n=2 Tax=Holotrichia oblita TaxID=644536 RepID=A0ACB9TKY8_HOLOL|nr:lipoma hmgic fusion partner-like protein [Holotrichia oblita]KAI4467573.1 lipoma hmgic fusion partner-like protein [Holotrichia oblita]
MYIIITLRSLLWILTSLIATLLMVSSLLSPHWLIGTTQTITVNDVENLTYTPTIGVYAKCGKPLRESDSRSSSCVTLAVRGLATESSIFPNLWKASTVFITIGLIIMSMTVMNSLASCCFQSIFRKSIFTVSGATQAVAGIFYILGIMLYPMGWGVPKVQHLCGRDASPFYPGNCSIGSGLYTAVLATVLTLVSACISLYAEKSTSSDKVQDHISEGQTLICLP